MKDRRNGDRRRNGRDYLMTDEQVALMAGVSVRTVQYWRFVGILPSVKVGRHPRVWWSVFQKVFHKPSPNGAWEIAPDSVNMKTARGIRRKS